MKTSLSKIMLCLMGIFIVVFSQLTLPKLFEFQFGGRFLCVLIAVCLCLLVMNVKQKKCFGTKCFPNDSDFGDSYFVDKARSI